MFPGSQWQCKRKIWASTFHNSILKDYIPIMNREAKKLTKMLTDDSIENGSVDIEEYLSSFAFDVVMGKVVFYS